MEDGGGSGNAEEGGCRCWSGPGDDRVTLTGLGETKAGDAPLLEAGGGGVAVAGLAAVAGGGTDGAVAKENVGTGRRPLVCDCGGGGLTAPAPVLPKDWRSASAGVLGGSADMEGSGKGKERRRRGKVSLHLLVNPTSPLLSFLLPCPRLPNACARDTNTNAD